MRNRIRATTLLKTTHKNGMGTFTYFDHIRFSSFVLDFSLTAENWLDCK